MKSGQESTSVQEILVDFKEGEVEHVHANEVEGRLTLSLILAVSSVTVGSSFLNSYINGSINAPMEVIQQFIRTSHYAWYSAELTDEGLSYVWGFSVSIYSIGAMIGGFCCGSLADKMGRRSALIFTSSFAIVASYLMTMSYYTNTYHLFTIGRFIFGINAGLNHGLVPIYITEIAPVNYIGILNVLPSLGLPIVIAQVLGLKYIFGTPELWHLIFAASIIPSIFLILTLPFCPESPKYNFIIKGRTGQAEIDLKKLRNKDDVKREIQMFEEELIDSKIRPQIGFLAMFHRPYRWPLLVSVMLMVAEQFSGINVAMYYSTKIFQDSGLNNEQSVFATIAMGIISMIMSFISIWMIDHPRFGRRILLLASFVGMFFSALFLLFSLLLATEYVWASYTSIIFMILFVVSFSVGLSPINPFYGSEIFPSNARGSANSIAVSINWLATFVVGLCFLPINCLCGPYTFLIFVLFIAMFTIFTYKYVPETKGKTAEEIFSEFETNTIDTTNSNSL